jgi:hypothetical protein
MAQTPEQIVQAYLIVRYMVARVDAVLRSELGIIDGLADKNDARNHVVAYI